MIVVNVIVERAGGLIGDVRSCRHAGFPRGDDAGREIGGLAGGLVGAQHPGHRDC